MATLADRILEAIRFGPLDDDVLATQLGVSQRQSINQVARRLESQGLLRRYLGRDGKIVNALPESTPPAPQRTTPVLRSDPRAPITEDEVKGAVRDHLAGQGFEITVAWGRTPGIDIEARHPDGRRYVIEAKAEKGTKGAQQHNYFVGMLGELLRNSDRTAAYGLALPDNRQYRGLVMGRLPSLARETVGLLVFWVSREGNRLVVELED